MLDWFSGTIGYSSDHIKTNKIIELSPSGEIMWQKDSHMQVEGSYSAKLQIAKQPPTIEMQDIASNQRLMCARLALRLSGNPVKFLQGHNVFGPDVSWLPYVLQDTCRAFPDELGVDISLPYDRNQARRETFDLEYLKKHEIKNVPADFPGQIYRPKLFA